MADIAESDQFSIFMRKIGYSVALEHTFSRLIDLANVYAANCHIALADWQNLVYEKWELKTDNIADVFRALEVIQRARGTINVLPMLDMLGVLRLEYKKSEF